MKRFSIVCCLVLLLNMFCPAAHVHAEGISTPTDLPCEHYYTVTAYDDTHHWKACEFCGAEWDGSRGAHEESCDNPGVCWDCQQSNVTFTISGHAATAVWEYDDTTCTLLCPICREVFINGIHREECTNPGVCTNCQQTGVTFSVTDHPGDVVWEYDSTTHTQYCSACDVVYVDGGQHVAYCNAEDTSVCLSCGAANVETRLLHGDMVMLSDETHHWYGCVDCGEPLGDKILHGTYCDQPDSTVCQDCGAQVDPADVELYHIYAEDTPWEFDEYSHWRSCVCGEMEDRWSHEVYCSGTDSGCLECGYMGPFIDVFHCYGFL